MNAHSDATLASILVVENHAPLRRSIVAWLGNRFPATRIRDVESGEEAVDHARRSHPDIVLMDIHLPGFDGFEAARRIKALVPATAVVMLSIHDTPYHRLAAIRSGATDYLAKPDIETKLAATVERLLRSRPGARS